MGLKFVSCEWFNVFDAKLKSDQNGIEMHFHDRRADAERALKSDQNGIEIQLIIKFIWCDYWLKSDQNGIEIWVLWRFLLRWGWLKSDQNGIEIHRSNTIHDLPIQVKIRPKWDWNFASSSSSSPATPVKIRPKWDWNWLIVPDRLKIHGKLKSDQNGIEMANLIEPFSL